MKMKKYGALLLALALLAGLLAVPVQAEEPVGTKPVTMPGDVMDDEMGYTDINDIAWGTDWISQNIVKPDGFTQEWPDSGSQEQGKVEFVNGKIKLTRISGQTAADAAVKRILSKSAQPKDDMTVEFEYVKEQDAKIYIAMEPPTSGGPFALVQNADGSFTAAGQGSGGGLSALKATGTVKITMHLHRAAKNLDVYVNDQLLKKGYGYDPRYTTDINAGNLKFVLQKSAPSAQGITINYVRYMETSEYAKIAMAKDAKSVDCTGLPQDGASITENVTLPALPEKFPYGSTGVWESSDDGILNVQTGEVTRAENDQQVTLSLKLSKFNETGQTATEATPTVSYTYTVTGTAADSGTPGTKPVSLPGDVMDDEMGYADINAVPWGYCANGAVGDGTEGKPLPYLFMYSTAGINQPAGFTGGTWYDSVAKAGTISVDNGKLRMVRTAAKGSGGTISMNKFLTLGPQQADDMTVELEYVKDAGAKMQVNIQSPNNWKFAIQFTHNAEGKFEGVSGAANLTSAGKTKLTMHLHKTAKTADIYVNDKLLKKGFAYDSRYSEYYDAGKLGINILADTEQNKGFTLNYIRYMETAEYANIALAKDKKQSIALSGLPEDGATLENNLTMPEIAQLPYGSEAFWESSDNTILDPETGEIFKRLEEQQVTLTLKLKKLNEAGEYAELGAPVAQRTYTVAQTNATLQDDVDNLKIEDILGNNTAADQITTALVLPAVGKFAGSEISWTMDPEDAPVDLETGDVTRPVYGDDIPVKLTATFSAGGESKTKEFDITILTQPAFINNLAQGKTATASTVYSNEYGADQAVDGNKTTTRWASKGVNSWIQIDLGQPTKVSALRFYEFAQRIKSFVVESSNDGTNWTIQKTETGLPSSSTANREAYTTEFAPVSARYFRLRQTAGVDNITIFEVELYDTTVRRYESAASVNDETLGSVQTTGGPGFALGAEVTLTAQPSITGKFVQWQLPEGLALTEGTAQSMQIKYLQPQKNLKLTAEFEEKTPATIDLETAVYDKYETSQQHKDLDIVLTPGDYSFQSIQCGNETLAEGEQYRKNGNTFTILQSWMDTLEGQKTIVFQMDGGNQPALKLEVRDSDPTLLIKADLAALPKLEYQLQDGAVIPAVGTVNGSDITVTASDSSIVQISRETVNGALMNKIKINFPSVSKNLTLTVKASLSGVSMEETSRYAVKGTGSGSGGSGGGGGGGGSVSRPSGSGVINYGNGTNVPENPQQPPAPPETKPGRFRDMENAAWAADYVELLADKGIVSGDVDGNYQPEREVTREEYVKMVVLALGLEPAENVELPFDDIAQDDWSYPYIAAAYQAGIISGTGEGTFGAGATMSRQDIAVITARALDAAEVEVLPVTDQVNFTDSTTAADYAADSIEKIARGGIVGGYPDGSFRPEETITRAEAAKVLAQIVRLKEA